MRCDVMRAASQGRAEPGCGCCAAGTRERPGEPGDKEDADEMSVRRMLATVLATHAPVSDDLSVIHLFLLTAHLAVRGQHPIRPPSLFPPPRFLYNIVRADWGVLVALADRLFLLLFGLCSVFYS